MTHKQFFLSIIAGLLLLAPAEGLYAQSRSETSQFNKTMKKPSVKAADKFLKKYPSSVYAPKVQQMKDSLLYLVFVEQNVSRITHEDAIRVSGGKPLDAIGWKKDGQEHILSLEDDFSLRVLSPDGVLQERRFLNVYTMEETSHAPVIVTPMEIVTPFGKERQLIHFAYRLGDREFVEALYNPEEDLLSQAIFYGTPLTEGRIEGQSPEMMEGVKTSGALAQPGDDILVTGDIGRHGAAILLARGDYGIDADIKSDCAPLAGPLLHMLEKAPTRSDIHTIRDATRGGVGTVLHEIANESRVGIDIDETALPIAPAVRGLTGLLGLTPLYLACEGRAVILCRPSATPHILQTLKKFPDTAGITKIGTVTQDHPARVTLTNATAFAKGAPDDEYVFRSIVC